MLFYSGPLHCDAEQAEAIVSIVFLLLYTLLVDIYLTTAHDGDLA
jgi:hypothetical protein